MPPIKVRAVATDEIRGPAPRALRLLSSHPLPLTAAALLLLAPSAQAATRYAAPTGAGTTCTQDAPCAVADAVSGAVADDDLVLAPGDYDVATPLKATVRLSIAGLPGAPRPRLLGASLSAGDVLTLSSGGAARHLEI